MVAYSFQKRFILPIREGTKLQTIRALRTGRSRHACPGEMLQLYFGMRTAHCRKIVDDRLCTSVRPVAISRQRRADMIDWIEVGFDDWPGRADVACLDTFARLDGFENIEDMAHFWARAHPEPGVFRGAMIEWAPPAEAGRVAA